MSKTVINRNLSNNPLEHFVDRTFSVYRRPQTPVVTMPPPRLEREAASIAAKIEAALKPVPPKPQIEVLTEHLARRVDPRLIERMGGSGPMRIADVLTFVAFIAGHTLGELLGTSRKVPLVQTRQVAMWLAYRFTDGTYPAIGQKMAGRDHTTIIHGVRTVQDTIDEAKITPESDTPLDWIVPLLAEHGEAGYRRMRTRGKARNAVDRAALSSVRKQALAAYRQWKDDPHRPVQSVDRRSVMDRRHGSEGAGAD